MKRGKYGRTWAHLNIMIGVTIELDSEFADEVITTFIVGKLLEYRGATLGILSFTHFVKQCLVVNPKIEACFNFLVP